MINREKEAALTQERLKELIHYDPDTGEWTWREWGHHNRYRLGDKAGGFDPDGYRLIRIKGYLYRAHRLAFLYMTGQWPKTTDVDHINMDKADNRWANLREATRSQNKMNVGARTSLKGVCQHKKDGMYNANITYNGVQHWLGRFDCPAAAHFTYIVAADKLFGEFARAS